MICTGDKMTLNDLFSQLPLQYEYYPIHYLVMVDFENNLNWMQKEEKEKLFNIFDKPANSMKERIKFLLNDAFALKILDGINTIGTIYFWDIDLEKMEIGDMRLVLAPEYQHKGIGYGVIDYLLYWLQHNDFKIISASIEQKDVAAIKCFEKAGFRKTEKDKYSIKF